MDVLKANNSYTDAAKWTYPTFRLLSMLKERMSWLNQRQDLLSQNVANADMPGYAARDLKPMDFAQGAEDGHLVRSSSSGLVVTNPRHIALSHAGGDRLRRPKRARHRSRSPSGNSVSLEEEMIKVADTQAQYQAATNLYAKAIGMMKTAIGKKRSRRIERWISPHR